MKFRLLAGIDVRLRADRTDQIPNKSLADHDLKVTFDTVVAELTLTTSETPYLQNQQNAAWQYK